MRIYEVVHYVCLIESFSVKVPLEGFQVYEK